MLEQDLSDLVGAEQVDEALQADRKPEVAKRRRGLAYSLPVRCVSVDADGNTLYGSASIHAGTPPRLPIRSERDRERLQRKLDNFSSLPRLSSPTHEGQTASLRLDEETGYAEIPWHKLPERELSHATLSRVYRRERAQATVDTVGNNLHPRPVRQKSLTAVRAKVELERTKGKALRRRRQEDKHSKHRPDAASLSVAQIDGLKDAFGSFDENGDGTISVAELHTLMQSIGYSHKTQDELLEIVRDIDADNSDTLDFTEFLTLVQHTAADDGSSALSDGQAAALWLAKLESNADWESRSRARRQALAEQIEDRRAHLRFIEDQIKKSQKAQHREAVEMDRIQAAAMARSQFAHLRWHKPTNEPEPEPEAELEQTVTEPQPEPERPAYPPGPEGMLMKQEAAKARRAAIEEAAVAQAEAYKHESGARLTAAEQRANALIAERNQREAQKVEEYERRAAAVARKKKRTQQTEVRRKLSAAEDSAHKAQLRLEEIQEHLDAEAMARWESNERKSLEAQQRLERKLTLEKEKHEAAVKQAMQRQAAGEQRAAKRAAAIEAEQNEKAAVLWSKVQRTRGRKRELEDEQQGMTINKVIELAKVADRKTEEAAAARLAHAADLKTFNEQKMLEARQRKRAEERQRKKDLAAKAREIDRRDRALAEVARQQQKERAREQRMMRVVNTATEGQTAPSIKIKRSRAFDQDAARLIEVRAKEKEAAARVQALEAAAAEQTKARAKAARIKQKQAKQRLGEKKAADVSVAEQRHEIAEQRRQQNLERAQAIEQERAAAALRRGIEVQARLEVAKMERVKAQEDAAADSAELTKELEASAVHRASKQDAAQREERLARKLEQQKRLAANRRKREGLKEVAQEEQSKLVAKSSEKHSAAQAVNQQKQQLIAAQAELKAEQRELAFAEAKEQREARKAAEARHLEQLRQQAEKKAAKAEEARQQTIARKKELALLSS